jgi:hypothetical protein
MAPEQTHQRCKKTFARSRFSYGHGDSTVSPRQAIRISLSPVRLSAAGFSDGVVHQYSAAFVLVLGDCVLFARFQLRVQSA